MEHYTVDKFCDVCGEEVGKYFIRAAFIRMRRPPETLCGGNRGLAQQIGVLKSIDLCDACADLVEHAIADCCLFDENGNLTDFAKNGQI